MAPGGAQKPLAVAWKRQERIWAVPLSPGAWDLSQRRDVSLPTWALGPMDPAICLHPSRQGWQEAEGAMFWALWCGLWG